MFKWFRGPERRSNHTLREQIEELEKEASRANENARPQLFNRAGDLCLREGVADAAKRFYGQAIDAYIQIGFFDPAAAMCRKLLRSYPDVVRAHATLALLSVGNELIGDAEQEVVAYVEAARRADTLDYAVPRLRLMASATENARVRLQIAAVLKDLGYEAESAQLPDEGHPRSNESWSPAERWDRLVKAALAGPEDLL